jgi:hypothetical protein
VAAVLVAVTASAAVTIGAVTADEPVAAPSTTTLAPPRSSIDQLIPATLRMPTTTTVATTTTTTTLPPPPRPAPPDPAPPAPPPPPSGRTGALCIGDSVMEEAGPKYRNLLTMCGVVDTNVSRQFRHADDVARAHGGGGGVTVVVHLGANGRATQKEVDDLLAAVPQATRVVLVNMQSNGTLAWEAENNAFFPQAVARCGKRCVLGDWKGYSEGHPDWFRSDRIHLTGPGATAYTALIASLV